MITSTSNDRVRKVVSYNEKSKARREDDVFVIEGMKMLREAPVLQVREVYVTERFVDHASEDDKEILWRYGAETVSEEVMNKMSDTQTPQGVLAVVKQSRWTIADMLKGNPIYSQKGKLLYPLLQFPPHQPSCENPLQCSCPSKKSSIPGIKIPNHLATI